MTFLMMMTGIQKTGSCQACKDRYSGNRQSDTVKVDFGKLATAENTKQLTKEELAYAEEEKRLLAEEAERRRLEEEEEERLRQEEEERLEILRQRQLQLEEEERRMQEELRLRQQRAEEERRRVLEQRKKEEAERLELARIAAEKERQRQREEEERRRQEEQRRKEEAEILRQAKLQKLAQDRNAKLQVLLENAGFSDLDEKKVKKGLLGSSFKYPIHAAVEARDAEFVNLLLWAGADTSVQNSKKQTPLMLAEAKNNEKNSHGKVIGALRRAASAGAGGA